MKRIIISLAFALAVVFGCYAQEQVVETQLESREQVKSSRRTMAGYKAFYEAGYLWGYYGNIEEGKRDPDRFSVATSQGTQFNNFIYAGVGMAYDVYRFRGKTYLSVPVFVNARFNFLNDKKVLPFADVRIGYSLGSQIRGFYWEGSIGVRFGLPKHHAVFASVGTMFLCNVMGDNLFDDSDWGMYGSLGLRVGYES